MSQALKSIDHKWSAFAKALVEKAGIMDQRFAESLLRALIDCPHAFFLEQKYQNLVLRDIAIPVGYEKFDPPLSLIVRMLGLLAPSKGDRILVAGCGSGFIPALCVTLGAQAYVVETNGLLAQKTRKRLDRSRFQNVLIRTGNALSGWDEYGPFSGIFVTSAVSAYPRALSQQLDPLGGKLVCVVGAHPQSVLQLGERFDAELKMYSLEQVRSR